MTGLVTDTPRHAEGLATLAEDRRIQVMDAEPRKLRRLSSIEAAMAYSHATLAGNTQATFMLSVNGDLSLARSLDSIARIAARHEILSCCIRAEGDELWFCKRPSFDLPLTEETLESDPVIERALAQETTRVLDPRESLWRLHILRQRCEEATHLIFTHHHAITDARTAQSLFIELLQGLDGADRAPMHFETLTQGADAVLSDAANVAPLPPSKPFAFLQQAELERRSTGIRIADLTDAESSQAQSLARRERLSINSTLVGLFVAAFCDAAAHPSIDVFTAISLRDRLIAGRYIDDLGCFIRVPAIPMTMDRNPLSIAARYGDALQRAVAAGSPPSRSHVDIRASAEATRAASVFAGIGVTNLGIVDALCEASRLEIVAYRPVVNRVGGNLGLALHIVRLRGRFHLTMTYPKPLMSDEIVIHTCDLMRRRLSEL